MNEKHLQQMLKQLCWTQPCFRRFSLLEHFSDILNEYLCNDSSVADSLDQTCPMSNATFVSIFSMKTLGIADSLNLTILIKKSIIDQKRQGLLWQVSSVAAPLSQGVFQIRKLAFSKALAQPCRQTLKSPNQTTNSSEIQERGLA